MPDKEVPKRYGTEKYPETFLIDSAGQLQQLLLPGQVGQRRGGPVPGDPALSATGRAAAGARWSRTPGPPASMDRKQQLYLWLATLFVAALLTADLIGGKFFRVGSIDLSVGMLAFPLTFVLTDVLNEFYGPAGPGG